MPRVKDHPTLRLQIWDDGSIVGPSGRLLRQFLDRRGYLRVNTYAGGVWSQHFSHVLVCETFHGPRPDGLQVAHRNGVRTDNRAENLRWATKTENEADKVAHGTSLRGERHHQAKLTEDDVRAIRAAVDAPSSALASLYGVGASMIRSIRSRRNWKHI